MDRTKAIEVIRKNWPYGRHQLSEALLTLIPGIRESDEEKIKNNIIKLLRFVRDTHHQYSDECNEAIVWFENRDKLSSQNSLSNILQEHHAVPLPVNAAHPKGEDYGIDSLWHAIQILTKTLGEVDGYQSDDGILEHKCALNELIRLQEYRHKLPTEVKQIKENLIKYLQQQRDASDFGGDVVTFQTWIDLISSCPLAYPSCSAEVEKQGEQNPTDNCIGCNNFKGCITCTDGDQYAYVTEQKPTDNLEPKFKVGDWIVQEGVGTYKVVEVCKSWYEVTGIDGNQYSIAFTEENNCHLWTIQDAKNGDVLCGYPTSDYPWIGIFNELNGEYTFKSYCFLQAGINGKFCPPSGVNIFGKRNVDEHNSEIMVPATKEQSELLFQKIKEAGYEWDACKKEVKKLNKKVMSDKEKAHQIAWETSKHYDPLLSKESWCEMAALDMASWKNEQKTALSEEDEEMLEGLNNCLTELEEKNGWRYVYVNNKDVELCEVRNWLKSLKDRVQPQPKQEWSEEDEAVLDALIQRLEGEDIYVSPHLAIKCLKTIKERYTWKPSEEQIGTLEQWLRNNRYNGEARYCYPIFDSLHQDLKKLREE